MSAEFESVLLIILGGVFANNYALEQFFGAASLLGFAKKEAKLGALGLAVTLVMLLTTLIAWPMQRLILEPAGLEYLQTLVFVAAVLVAAGLLMLIFRSSSLGPYLPLVALNSAVLGGAVTGAAADYGYLEALTAALGGGLGFTFAVLLMAGVESRIDETHVPKAFRGLPISLVAAGIVSMALVAFK